MKRSAGIFFLVLLTTSLFAQLDTGETVVSWDTIGYANTDSTESITANAISLREDSFFTRHKAFHQRWLDLFPSPLIMYFNGLPEEELVERPLKAANEDWKFWSALGLLGLLAVIRFGYEKDFTELGGTFRNWGISQQLLREIGVGIPFGIVLLNIFSALVTGFYLFLIVQQWNLVEVNPSWMLMLFSAGAVISILLMRYLMIKMAEMVFPFKKELRLYNYYELQLNRLMGLCLFPLMLLMAFSIVPVSTLAAYASYIVVVVLLIIRYLKGFNMGSSYFTKQPIHFLLYLCALEIAPILIVIRLLLNLGPIRFSF